MQIYRPGMGRFSSKNVVKKEEEEKNASPKTSPDESRDSSPNKKVSSKSSRNPSPEETERKREKGGRAKKKYDHQHDEEKGHNNKEYHNNRRKEKNPPVSLPSTTIDKDESKSEDVTDPAPAATPASKSKSYRANRLAKQKKNDTAAEVKKQENLSRAPLDEDNIPPLTSSKHVITLDNDQ